MLPCRDKTSPCPRNSRVDLRWRHSPFDFHTDRSPSSAASSRRVGSARWRKSSFTACEGTASTRKRQRRPFLHCFPISIVLTVFFRTQAYQGAPNCRPLLPAGTDPVSLNSTPSTRLSRQRDSPICLTDRGQAQGRGHDDQARAEAVVGRPAHVGLSASKIVTEIGFLTSIFSQALQGLRCGRRFRRTYWSRQEAGLGAEIKNG